MRNRTVAVLLVAALIASGPAWGDHRVGHDRPQGSAFFGFGEGFPYIADSEWGFRLGGWGGISPGAPRERPPVIFVHGNNVDAADWYPVQEDFLAAGWSLQEMYALSYNGLGGNNGSALFRANPRRDDEHQQMGWDGNTRVTANDVNVADLNAFINAVLSYTGADSFSIVAHSLGVTLARKTLKVHPELRPKMIAFVGIAGANHGTSFCPPGSETMVHSCDEIAAGTPWLDSLNGPFGSDETYGPAKWLTVSDGTGVGDPAFLGTYADSPLLAGADNRTFPFSYHNDLRLDPSIVAVYREFIETASGA